MSARERKTWLVCYDIADPTRLRRVHRKLVEAGAGVQYSAFVVVRSDADVLELLCEVDRLIDPARDDIRAYHLPPHCRVWAIGTQTLPAGVAVDPATASRLLLGAEGAAEDLGIVLS